MAIQTPYHTLTPGGGGLSKVTLTAPDGAQAEIYPYGAHVTRWVPAGGGERLFLSQTSEFRPGAAIRGGVPVIFPQFNLLGPLPKHGFARTSAWHFESVRPGLQGAVTARFELGETASSHAIWPHPFLAGLDVTVGGETLAISLDVSNTGETPFAFTGGLHTYFRVEELGTARLGGLQGRRYLVTGQPDAIQGEEWLSFAGEVDRVYPLAPSPLVLDAGEQRLQIAAAGFPDVVVWNPGPQKGAALADLEPDGYLRFVCVEAAAVTAPIPLDPGQTWVGSQILTAEY